MSAVLMATPRRLTAWQPPQVTFPEVVSMAAHLAAERRRGPAPVVALSGIDGSGKSHLAEALGRRLERSGLRVASIGIDPWQRPRSERIRDLDAGAHFYRSALRLDEFFGALVEPLVRERSIELETRVLRNDSDTPYLRHYRYTDVDLVLLEGIFLFRRNLMFRYDLSVWVECSFETALRRALTRVQEGLSRAETAAEYQRVYFPAQRHHFAMDTPQRRADATLLNEEEPSDEA